MLILLLAVSLQQVPTGFLDRTATHIMAFEGDSYVHWFAGNYSTYLEDFKKRKGKDAEQPHRIKYRKLTR